MEASRSFRHDKYGLARRASAVDSTRLVSAVVVSRPVWTVPPGPLQNVLAATGPKRLRSKPLERWATDGSGTTGRDRFVQGSRSPLAPRGFAPPSRRKGKTSHLHRPPCVHHSFYQRVPRQISPRTHHFAED